VARSQPHILLIQLEFPNWAQARAWTYPACFGVAEGLRANGATCTTIPLMANASFSTESWLTHARQAIGGRQFDQVWVWLVHSPLDPTVLEWITGLAPIRVGIVMESLVYEEEDYAWASHLRTRQGLVDKQLGAFTHALLPDERDVDSLASRMPIQTLWWPTMVPARFISPPEHPPVHRLGVFHGQPYGPRRQWVSHDALKSHLSFVSPASPQTRPQQQFDQLQQTMSERLSSHTLITRGQMSEYADTLRLIRETEFTQWMAQLPQWAAIVNLPSLAKFFGGRVYEGMAAGRPVLSYAVPHHPLNNTLFTEGEEILFFSPDSPDSLRDLLDRVIHDDTFADAIAQKAQRKLRAYHTSEHRMAQTLCWIETGQQPDYGIGYSSGMGVAHFKKTAAGDSLTRPEIPSGPLSGGSRSSSSTASTTVFVLTVDDPAFPSCMEALDRQEGHPCKLEIVRNVSPFSAAAQEMITRCTTSYFIQVDEDMILHPDAVSRMERLMSQAPSEVGMICFHLYDEDRECPIQGIKIYRTELLRRVSFKDLKASEMNLLDQMGEQGIRWVLHPDILGRHGTTYTPESIYRRYKTMYEKDIRQWNLLTADIHRKAGKFRETGDILQLFALLGAAHGIIDAPRVPDREKDARAYNLKELEIFGRLFKNTPPVSQTYDPGLTASPLHNPPIPFEQVRWNRASEPAQLSVAAPAVRQQSQPQAEIPPQHPVSPRQVLIVTPYFWPSVGGVETVAEDLGAGLIAAGLHVQVACYEQTDRSINSHRGIDIIQLAPPDQMTDGVPTAAFQVKQQVASNRYEACILLGSPMNALFYAMLEIPDLKSRRILFQPTINQEGYDFIQQRPVVLSLLKQLAKETAAVIALGHDTLDARFCRESDIPATIIPNGTPALNPAFDFRKQYGIPQDRFLVVHIANLYRVKNHLGLLDALQNLPPRAMLAMVGHPTHETEYGAEVQRVLVARPDVLYIPGLDREGVAAAMQAANLVVLSSEAEVSPLCILESMSMQRPWMATPGCGTANEQAGGLILPLSEFRSAVAQLMAHPEFCAELAHSGYEHWKSCFQWERILAGWVSLVREGYLSQSFDTPEAIARTRDHLRAQFHSLRTVSSTRQQPAFDPRATVTRTQIPATVSPDPHKPEHSPGTPSHEGSMDQDQFYINMFVKSPGWSTPEPNDDEAARWSKIAGFLEHILRRVKVSNPNATLRILEVGSGRGWLSNLASQYGTVEGVEPVAGVVAHARKMFPHIRFEAGTAEAVLSRPDFIPYDVVLCSEVIEHVPDPQKSAFLEELRQLLTSEGYLIMTTPRGEMWEQWQRIAPPCQPIEDWITEERLAQHMTAQGFTPLGLERIYVEIPTLRYIPAPTPHNVKTMNLLPIYQVWVAQRTAAAAVQPRAMINKPPMVSVIIPTYNRPDRLRMALTSVLDQDFQDFQIVVVNDGTTPVEEIVADLNRDGRITLITHDRNRGLAASRNTGLRQASGKYVCYLDDDDRFLPHHLRTLVSHLEESGCKVAYTDAWRVHERLSDNTVTEIKRDQPYAQEFNPHQLLIGNYIPVLCLMHERAVLDEVGGFDESLFVHEDWDLWIRMATRYPFKHLAVTTAEFTWRTDGSSMSSQRKDIFLRTMEIIYRKYAPYAAKYAGVRENQQQYLANFRKEHARKQFVCSIIIPVWNKVELTRQCLVALGPATDDVSFELIVIDNHSTDGTPEFLASLGGDVRIITNDENLGFARACNQGAAIATGENLVFLNNDTIPLKGWLSALVEEVRTHPDVTVVGSKLLYEDGTVQHAGVAIDRYDLTPYHIYNGFAGDHPAVNKRRELNAVTGACLLIRRSVFAEIGGFDEGFINGFEDVDLCLKVRDKRGRIVYQPRSVLYHLESQTPGRKQHDQSNANRLHQRWGHCWWLVDDDGIYAGDGYKAVGVNQNGRTSYTLHLIDSTQERQTWDLVATMQRAAHDQDLAAVEAILRRHAEWPADSSILQWAASVATAMKLPSVAEEYRRRVESLNDPAFRELEEIRAALAGGQLSTASTRVDALLKQYPTHAEALLLRAILHMQREQYREAEIAFTTALNQGANRKKCLMGIGMASMGRAYPQGAWQTFLRVLAENPDDADVIHWLLRAGTAQNRWRELSVQLHNYLARNPSDLSVRFAYAGVLLRADQVDTSRQEYDQLRALAPMYEGLVELGQAIAAKESVLAMNVSNA
jgi:GT2 family glycosyltransferase/glycosyltransferase involved in cell wall biosynthesis/2-polyprenyl-3-methyl-5-hydroxy-6-metoxy-1,4-benzoquinol methylase/Flp pilus assembly protein TadD